jgi:hypothetical protein
VEARGGVRELGRRWKRAGVELTLRAPMASNSARRRTGVCEPVEGGRTRWWGARGTARDAAELSSPLNPHPVGQPHVRVMLSPAAAWRVACACTRGAPARGAGEAVRQRVRGQGMVHSDVYEGTVRRNRACTACGKHGSGLFGVRYGSGCNGDDKTISDALFRNCITSENAN